MYPFYLSDFKLFCVDVALDREVEGDLLVGDMGQGMPFRAGAFDGCIRWTIKLFLRAFIFSGFVLNHV